MFGNERKDGLIYVLPQSNYKEYVKRLKIMKFKQTFVHLLRWRNEFSVIREKTPSHIIRNQYKVQVRLISCEMTRKQ